MARTIRIPVGRILGVLRRLVAMLPGGISPEEARELGQALVEIGLDVLGQVIPEQVEIPFPEQAAG